MSTSNTQVAHIWAQGHGAGAKGSNFHCVSNRLYSYSTCVGVIYDGVVFLSSDNMTPTTGKQLSYAKRACSYNYFETPAFRYGYGAAPTVTDCIHAAAEAILDAFKTLCRSRSHLESRIKEYTKRRQEIIDMAARFNVSIPELPEATGGLKEKAKQFAAQEREAARTRKEEQERKAAEQRQRDKVDFKAWLTTGAGRCPASFITRGADQITIKQDMTVEALSPQHRKIITSQGAECPLEHAVKALRFWEDRRKTWTLRKYDGGNAMFTPWKTNGHKIPLGIFTLDAILEDGTVKAGCHTFTAAEIQRFVAQWREVLGL